MTMIARVLSNNFRIMSRFCLWHLSIGEVCLPSQSWSVGFLHHTHSRYLLCHLEAKMAEFIPGLGGFREIFLVASGAWRLMRVWRTLVLLSQFSCISFGISNQIRSFDILLFFSKSLPGERPHLIPNWYFSAQSIWVLKSKNPHERLPL